MQISVCKWLINTCRILGKHPLDSALKHGTQHMEWDAWYLQSYHSELQHKGWEFGCNITMEIHHVQMGKLIVKWPCSIAMLVIKGKSHKITLNDHFPMVFLGFVSFENNDRTEDC